MAARKNDFDGGGEMNAILGRGSEFEGKLTFEGTVRIDGRFRGEIFTDDVLVIGEGAMIEAEILVGSAIINGEVTGNIRARRSIEVHAPARIHGSLITPSLMIDQGVIFEGNCRMESLDKAFELPPPGKSLAAGPTDGQPPTKG